MTNTMLNNMSVLRLQKLFCGRINSTDKKERIKND